jgi:small subunit ribosomal protein S20
VKGLANIKSAIKRIRVSKKKTERNKPIRSSIKTYVGKAEKSIRTGDENSETQLRVAISTLDKAAEKGVIHRNQAARRKSRLMAKYNKAQAKE